MKSPYDIIISPIISERSMDLMEDNKYVFKVDKRSNKSEIKAAIEQIFEGVKVAKVNTINMIGKTTRIGRTEGKRSDWKKAIVTLKEDSKTIEFFENM
ncbi:50S ribosomal protein L23 [Helcococcus kunzii]|uniref:Large ribosomal subunit protein uL23 n=1 Tax=Helcococcus kunzii ATCC 51366 TaxID=883114 RepID=H3NP66_9FIRM|nr:50S ribosomal protein L23 [Helcococcus kunzii]EHR33528.1 50S ribosomal protein L23 [Helcococcus kunzii ATCC 51366]MCT1795790.1 50S ribosomal protein L23 [Helcococcus kunzii]MCT1989369.1 50S ribosomal protein L23 [Helcococcus kunzii]QUY65032.1 50S ribosomal protein L23 [Helcococcus kunzii]QZO75739.1 50S ribosomal protein L23 [Helcococcus kunzii]